MSALEPEARSNSKRAKRSQIRSMLRHKDLQVIGEESEKDPPKLSEKTRAVPPSLKQMESRRRQEGNVPPGPSVKTHAGPPSDRTKDDDGLLRALGTGRRHHRAGKGPEAPSAKTEYLNASRKHATGDKAADKDIPEGPSVKVIPPSHKELEERRGEIGVPSPKLKAPSRSLKPSKSRTAIADRREKTPASKIKSLVHSRKSSGKKAEKLGTRMESKKSEGNLKAAKKPVSSETSQEAESQKSAFIQRWKWPKKWRMKFPTKPFATEKLDKWTMKQEAKKPRRADEPLSSADAVADSSADGLRRRQNVPASHKNYFMMGPYPCYATCPACRRRCVTYTQTQPSTQAWIICILLCLVGLDCFCCLIPLFLRQCQDINHYCSYCGCWIGRYQA